MDPADEFDGPHLERRSRSPGVGVACPSPATSRSSSATSRPTCRSTPAGGSCSPSRCSATRASTGDAELSVLFIDETAIAELNQRFMDKVGPTDVLAFPLEDELVEPGASPTRHLGPLDPRPHRCLRPAAAARRRRDLPGGGGSQRPEHRSEHHDGSVEDEIALLVVHGILHVLGHDHAEPEETARMQARERELLARYHRPPTDGGDG